MKLSIVTILSVLVLLGCRNEKTEIFKPFRHTNIPEGWSEKTLSYADFMSDYDRELNYQMIVRRGQVPKEEKRDLKASVWNNFINKNVINNEIKYLGVDVPKSEVKDFLIGKFIADDVKNNQTFQDPKTGKVSKQRVLRFINKVKKSGDEDLKATWVHFVDKIKRERLFSKYEDIINYGVQFTPQLGDWYAKFINKKSSVEILATSYKSFHDSVKITDDDYKTYLDSNSVFYMMQEQRYINVVEIPIKIHKPFHKQEFMKFNNYLANNSFDSIASKYPEILSFNSYYKKSVIPKDYKTFFDTAKSGSVSIPMFYDNSYRAIRLDSMKEDVPLQVKAEHFVMVDVSKEQVQKILDKVRQEVKAGKKFADVAKVYEDKMGDKCLYGETDWFLETEMVKPFSDACFYNKPGSIVATKSRYGWHIVHVLEHKKSEKRFFYSALYYPLKPAEGDNKSAITEASTFVKSLKNKEYYAPEAAANRYLIKEEQMLISRYQIHDLPGTEAQYKWAFKANLYDFSKPFIVGDKAYVIQVIRIIPPGVLPVDVALEFFRVSATNLKIKQYLKEKYNFDDLNKLDKNTISENLHMQPVTLKDIMLTQGVIPQFGTDHYLAGLINAFKVGEESKLILGQQGIFKFRKTDEKKMNIKTYLQSVHNGFVSKINNLSYIHFLLYFNDLIINRQRDQDSYILVEDYKDNLKYDSAVASEMYAAQAWFHQKKFKEALYGVDNLRGFDELSKDKMSKQSRLAKYYAAVCAYNLKRYDDVINYLQGIEFKDRFVSVISKGICGDAYLMKGENEKALEYYRKAEQAKLNYMITPFYLLKMVAIYDSLKDYKHARQILKEIKTKYRMGQTSFNIDDYIAYYDYILEPDKVLCVKK